MSSTMPTPRTTGVGRTGPAGRSLYRETLPDGTASPNADAASPIPRTASRKNQSRSGFSGFPKFRQFVIAWGRAPTATRFRHTSSTAVAPPRYGARAVYGPVEADAIARARQESTRGFTTAASPWVALPITPCIGFRGGDARAAR